MQEFLSRENDTKLILFIHGITGSINTWNNEKTSFFFPKVLFEEFNEHSVYIFEYDSNKLSKSTEFMDIVKKLFYELNSISVNKYSEIIFIGHSMGGLIAKAFLIDNCHISITNKVNKLILLATPNNGNFFPKIISYLSKNPQFNYLKPIDENIFLQQLTNMWIEQYGINGKLENTIQCYCGYEKLKTYLKLLVPLGTVSSPCCSILKGFEKNHITISKPSNKDDEVYLWIKTNIETKLSKIEKLSKQALSKLYLEYINNLENKIAELENIVLQNFEFNNQDTSINKYIFLRNDYKRIINSYEKFNDISNNLIISEKNITKLFELIRNKNLDEALNLFSEEEIDNEISQHIEQKNILLQKIKIKIELYNIKGDFINVEKYFNKIFLIERNEKDLLEYANMNKYKAEFKIAEKIYLEIITSTKDDLIKAICLNNLGTMANSSYISYEKALQYLKDSYSLYKNLYKNSSSENFLVFYIETKANFLLFNMKLKLNHIHIINELSKLLQKLELLDNLSEDFLRLKFFILNNILTIYIDYEIMDNMRYLKEVIFDLEQIVQVFIENKLHLQKKYADYISLYYYNCGCFYGNIFKSNINNNVIFNLSLENFNKALKMRNILFPKIQENLQFIIKIKKSIGIIYADSMKYDKEAQIIFKEALKNINELILIYPDNKKMYLEEKIEIIISYLSVDKFNKQNLTEFKEAIECLDILNNINPNAYNISYCRLILMILPSLSDNKEYQLKLFEMAKEKIKFDESNFANKMRDNLDSFKQVIKF
ncbi:hypothetical protein CJ673_09395 [Aliarcobacter cryaerophilus]|uniref:GPI inositol-deacylase PGAP1-like alpha/beta domain-containing protein n=1 Tax=Aliarcobacter cryaerophilus TaxID=28198 RepID=A0A2S9T4G6_9BACT|nr:hypothetical protein [Aliarcobacter cryaerophilus]PRM93679.1 hypothetical protein CJ673_09395 [Aliarcobacter cryaerophilus]